MQNDAEVLNEPLETEKINDDAETTLVAKTPAVPSSPQV